MIRTRHAAEVQNRSNKLHAHYSIYVYDRKSASRGSAADMSLLRRGGGFSIIVIDDEVLVKLTVDPEHLQARDAFGQYMPVWRY